MRIVLLSDSIPPENRGGAGKVAWNLALGLQKRGHEVHVIAATKSAPFEALREGIPTYHLHSAYQERFVAWMALYNPQTIPPLKKLLERIRPDVVNAHNIHLHLSYAALRSAHQMRIATVFNSHDVMPFAYQRLRHFVDPARCEVNPADYRLPAFYNLRENRFRYNPFRNLMIRSLLRRHADLRISVSEAHRAALHANGLPPFEVVYNGIDPADFAVSAERIETLRKQLNLDGRRVILTAGRPSEDKGGPQLLAALEKVVQIVPEALVLILGTEKPLPAFENARFALLLKEHLRFSGWVEGETLAAAYHLADVVTVPSVIMDSFPTVNLEAMAARRPVIATCYGGSSEAVIDGQTGYIVNPYDSEAFAGRMIALLRDAPLCEQMGRAGYERIRAHFLLENQVSAMEAYYQQAIRRQQPG